MVAITIGRRGLRPSESRPATIAPAPCAAMIAPQTAAPPRYEWPSTGPSSIQGAQVIRLTKANWTVTTHSQVRDRKPVQPSAMSENRIRRPGPPGCAFSVLGSWSRLRASTLAR
jgi:hypothetical protein